MAAILTKTVLRSPVVRWILHLRIRGPNHNDVVLVGDDFVDVREIREHGHLEPVALKTDFDARIRAARSFSNDTESTEDDFFVKMEQDGEGGPGGTALPQFLVLTLDTNDLLFLYVVTDLGGVHRFAHQVYAMPSFDHVIFQPGEHLAVDQKCRALAVAAHEREVVLYSAKSRDRIARELRAGDRTWCPISSQKPLRVEGVIQHMDFLTPSRDDGDHIVLLLIVIDERKVKALWIEWYDYSDLHSAQIHTGQPLDHATSVSSLLIPLRDAAFLLVNGSEITRWNNLISGSATGHNFSPVGREPLYPGASPRRPTWASWTRPSRTRAAQRDNDHLYLVREDGAAFLFQVGDDRIISSHAGDFGCHVGSAFAALGGPHDPDILAVAGEMSSGCIKSIGTWFTPIRVAEMSRSDTMEMELVETLPSWSAATDMVVSNFHGRSQRSRDGVFVTSCRQPFGAVTELRRGLEARLSVYSEDLPGLQSVTDIWALPIPSVGSILILLSSPSNTRFMEASADMGVFDEIDGTTLALDASHSTLAAGAASDGRLIQVTTASVCVTPGSSANFEDTLKIDCEPSKEMLCAAIDLNRSVIVTAQRTDRSNSSYSLMCYILLTDDTSNSSDTQLSSSAPCALQAEPRCLAIITDSEDLFVVVSTTDGRLDVITFQADRNLQRVAQKRLPEFADGEGACDHIAIIRPQNRARATGSSFLIVCGLRNGALYAVTAHTQSDNGFTFGDEYSTNFGQSSVKLVQPQNDSTIAYAMSGMDTCLLSWDGHDASSLKIQSIWLADKERPELAQGPIAACTHMPSADMLSLPDLSNCLVMVSGKDLLVTDLLRSPTTVPRQISLTGTPNRLIYSEQQRCFVCASRRYDVRSFKSRGDWEERRQIWPIIDFIPSRSDAPSFTHSLQPEEKVYALLEWSYKRNKDKVYSFILVAGSSLKQSGATRGRIRFLQPLNKNWEVVGVKEGQTMNFESPVYALAALDDLTCVICSGQNVIVSRFFIEDRKWVEICAPFKLLSAGVYVTTSRSQIFVSTAQDSLVTLRLESLEDQASGSEYRFYLRPLAATPRADALLSHVNIVTTGTGDAQGEQNLVLISTKYDKVVGMRLPHPPPPQSTQSTQRQPQLSLSPGQERGLSSAETLFEAQLPRSLTRIRQGDLRPSWKPTLPRGVVAGNLLGCAADGSLVGVALLDEPLWRRLSWLQRLCEWSERLSPHSHAFPAYSVEEDGYATDERAVPIGLRENAGGDVLLRTYKTKLSDGHVDGDVLARALERGGTEELKEVMRHVAARDNRVGRWLTEHLDEEMSVVDETVQMLGELLDMWI